jgi:hypothetical protein
MKCPICGTDNVDGWQFCVGCGRSLIAASSAIPVYAVQTPSQQQPIQLASSPPEPLPQPRPPAISSRAKRNIAASIACITIVIVLILAVFLSPSLSPLSTVHDLDGDGYPDARDLFPNDATEWNDTDGDGHGDNSDAFPTNASEWVDSDGDGHGDNSDAFPEDATEWNDTDRDGHGDNSDAFPTNASEWVDSDGDGHGENSDAFPSDSTEWKDSDGDGVGDNSDSFPNDPTRWLDSDGDGYEDSCDAFPYDSKEWNDTDGDGHGDNSDAFPTNATEWIDSDGDGYGDNSDALPFDPTEWIDTDGDGHGDNSDILPLDPTRWRNPINITYSWTFDGQLWSLPLSISGESYDNYRELPRTTDWPVYVTDNDSLILDIASSLDSMAASRGYDSYDTARFVLTFVQSLPYTVDLDTTGHEEYPRYPVETLADNGGDCEDTAILYAAIMQASPLSYDAILIELPGHMATGIWGETWMGWYYNFQGRVYIYCETTELGWDFGDIPSEFIGVGATLYQV